MLSEQLAHSLWPASLEAVSLAGSWSRRPPGSSRPVSSVTISSGSFTHSMSSVPPEKYLGLRSMALHSAENGLPSPPPSHPWVSGAVVDIPLQGGFATLVALTDNTTGLYTSVDGGTIGLGSHPPVPQAIHQLLTAIEPHLGEFWTDEDEGFPSEGFARIHVLLPDSRRAADVPEASFWGKEPHQLMPVIGAVQGVMTASRPLRARSDRLIQSPDFDDRTSLVRAQMPAGHANVIWCHSASDVRQLVESISTH